MASQEERRTQTRKKIIQAAKKLFDKQGYDATSVDQIVKAANVAKGTFYQYYEAKIDVLSDVSRDESAPKAQAALESVAKGAPAIPVLEKYVMSLCEWFEGKEKIAEALIFNSLQSVGSETTSDPHRYSRAFLFELMKLAQAQGTLRDDIPAAELAKILGASMAISVLGWSKSPQPGKLTASMQQTLKIFLQGALPQGGSS